MYDTQLTPVSAELDSSMVLVQVHISCWSGQKTDSEVTGEFTRSKKAEDSAGAFRKTLINGEELRELSNEGARARRLIYNNALPWIGGASILPVGSMAALKVKLEQQAERFNAAADKFVAKYDQLREEARKRLGDLYSDDDYPPAAVMRDKFRIAIYWLPVGATNPAQMKLVDDVAKEIAKSALQAQADATREAKHDLGKRIRETVLGLAEALEHFETRAGQADARPIFREARLDAIDQLYDLVANCKLDDSGDMEELAGMLGRLKVHSVEEVRSQANSRKDLLAQCDAIRLRMNNWN